MRKKAKKIVALFSVFAMTVMMFGQTNVVSAKKSKPSMKKKVTIHVSEKKTLKITKIAKSKIKKTTWKVSNSKKLKLTKKGKTKVILKGVKTGTAKVTAVVKTSKKTYRLKTKVKITKKSVKKDTSTQSPAPEVTTSVPSVKPSINPTGTPVVTTAPATTPVSTPTVTPTIKPTETPASTPEATPKENVEMKIMESLPAANTYDKTIDPPDILKMLDGTQVKTKDQWLQRKEEVKAILQRYMYGIWRDGAGEKVSYEVEGNTISITIERDGKKASFDATYSCPDGTAPEGGWPVLVSVGAIGNGYIAEAGYATISFNPSDIASDDTKRNGAFYTLYPYSMTDWKEQTGTVMAWAWGVAKILDAVNAGAGSQLSISNSNSIVTGVSRYGKAAAAAGAFDERIKVSMPVCSGYGGMTMARYSSNGLTYNLLPDYAEDPKVDDVSDLSAWLSTGGNEPINSLQGAGWFNEEYKSFASYQNLPFDAHFIASLSASENHYLFIVTGINSDMWNSPPGFWWCFQEAKPVYDLMGVTDNLAIQMHLNLHGLETEDLCKLFAFTDNNFYNKPIDTTQFPAPWNEIYKNFKLDDLKTCVFASDANKEAYEAGFPVDSTKLPPNPDQNATVKVAFADVETSVVVHRSSGSDALVSELTGDAAQTGFKFRYGPEKQYGDSYARFELKLPEEKNLSDYSSVTFTCQTDSNYYGKRMALVVNPLSTGLPEKIDYDYESGAISNAVSVTGGLEFPNNTSTARELTMNIDKTVAGTVDGTILECAIYLHMECAEGKAEYTITNIKFNP